MNSKTVSKWKRISVIAVVIVSVLLLGVGAFADDYFDGGRTWFASGMYPTMGFRIYQRYNDTTNETAIFEMPLQMYNGWGNNVVTTISRENGPRVAEFTYRWTTPNEGNSVFRVSEYEDNQVSLISLSTMFNPYAEKQSRLNYIACTGTSNLPVDVTYNWSGVSYINGAKTAIDGSETLTANLYSAVSTIAPSLQGYDVDVFFDWYEVVVTPRSSAFNDYEMIVSYRTVTGYTEENLPSATTDIYEEFKISTLFQGVADALDAPIIGVISIKQLLFVTVGLGLMMMFLKFFAGG